MVVARNALAIEAIWKMVSVSTGGPTLAAHAKSLAVDQFVAGKNSDSDTGDVELLHAGRNVIFQLRGELLNPLFDTGARRGGLSGEQLLNTQPAKHGGDYNCQKATAETREPQTCRQTRDRLALIGNDGRFI